MVPDNDSRFPDPVAVAEIELLDPNTTARRCSAVKMSLSRAVRTWDHGHERERERQREREYQLEVSPKVRKPLLNIVCIYLAKYPHYILGEVLPPSNSQGGTKGEGAGGAAGQP